MPASVSAPDNPFYNSVKLDAVEISHEHEVLHFTLIAKESQLEKAESLHKKSFPLRISSVNVTKSAVFCRSGHIY